MGKQKENKLEDIKKSLKTVKKQDLKKITGGKKLNNWNNNGCGGIIPQ